MITEALFFIAYLVVLPIVFMFPYAGALAYEWLQYMPPYDVYNAYGLSNFSLIMGGLGLGLVLDRVGMLYSLLDFALACPAQSGAALVRNTAFLAQRYAQQVAVLRCRNHLCLVRDERNLDHRLRPSHMLTDANGSG